MKWTCIAPIRDSIWLDNYSMPLSLEKGAWIDLIPENCKELIPRENLGQFESEQVLRARHAFFFQYEANKTRGFTEPMQDDRSMLPIVHHTISLANLALWISKPNGLVFVAYIHFRCDGETRISHYSKALKFIPHMDYMDDSVQNDDIANARIVFQNLLDVNSEGTTWRAIYSIWTGLRERDWATRFMQAWMGLEALFGPEDGREISFRISQRIALFLESDLLASKELFRSVKESYKWRSEIVHGQNTAKLDHENVRRHTLFVEKLLARILLKELTTPNLLRTFESADRELFLDNLVFEK